MEMWALGTFTLVVGMIDDLRSRKVHNVLVLAMLPIILAFNFYFRGFDGTLIGASAGVAALILTIPLFMFGVLGGGDVKLFTAFAFCLEPVSMFWTLIYSIVWGSLFGVTRAVLQKNLLALVRNTTRTGRGQRIQRQEIHPIPFTFALLLGWLTQLTILRAGGFL